MTRWPLWEVTYMKGSECRLIEYMEGSKKRFIIPVYQRRDTGCWLQGLLISMV